MSERQLRSSCACGWQVTGTEDEVVAATIEHGARVHNMPATRDQVLARAEVVEDGSERRPGSAA
jgi:predicted small metal-binding protein